MKRRQLLAALAALPCAGLRAQAVSAPAAHGKFLLVFLRGGLDTQSLLVPISSEFYYRVRPNIAVARPGSGDAAAIALDSDWGLHPALGAGVLPLWQQRQAAFVAFTGPTDLSRSHFETQDSIELGQEDASNVRDFGSGFLNRLVTELGAYEPIAFTEQVPLALRGHRRVVNVVLAGASKPALDDRQRKLVEAMYAGTPLEASVHDGLQVRAEIAQELAQKEHDDAGRGAAPPSGLEQSARRMALLLRDRYDIGFIDLGGWDTHVNQGNGKGQLATRLGQLDAGISSFARAMGDRWRDTTVVVLSEFGRTSRENGNRGTDHGHGTAFLVLGGSLRGGRVAGEQVAVDQKNLFQDRDLPVLQDGRAVLGGIFSRMYGLSRASLDRIFPRAKPVDLGLV